MPGKESDSLKAAHCKVLYNKGPLPISKCHLDNGKLGTLSTEVVPQPLQTSHFTKCKRTLPTHWLWALGSNMSDRSTAPFIAGVRGFARKPTCGPDQMPLSSHTRAFSVAVYPCSVLLSVHITSQPQTDCNTRMPDVGPFSGSVPAGLPFFQAHSEFYHKTNACFYNC